MRWQGRVRDYGTGVGERGGAEEGKGRRGGGGKWLGGLGKCGS